MSDLVWTCKTSIRVWFEMNGRVPLKEKNEGGRIYYGYDMTPAEAARLEKSFTDHEVQCSSCGGSTKVEKSAGQFERRRRRFVEKLRARGNVGKPIAGSVGG